MSLWILVANASAASIYSSPNSCLWNNHAKLNRVRTFEHLPSRLKDEELTTDKFGHSLRNNQGHGDYAVATEPKEYEAEKFAHELTEELEYARVSRQFDELIVIAPPHFHGLLNRCINGPLSKMVTLQINKDYTKDNTDQLQIHLKQYYQGDKAS